MPAFDIKLSVPALKAAAEWADDSVEAADVLLLVDDRMLIAYQGDDAAAWDTDGTAARQAYLDAMPLSRRA